MKLLEEKLLRYAAPALYKRMEEIFATYHLHPYDVQANVLKNEDGWKITLMFSADFSRVLTKHFSFAQAALPDEEVNRFFIDAAEKCKTSLIADYYKMMKL